MGKVTDMDAWVRGKNKAFYEEEELHAQFLAEWEALYPSKDSMYTLVSPDRTGKEFRELRDELDKHGMDYKVVSTWVRPQGQEEE